MCESVLHKPAVSQWDCSFNILILKPEMCLKVDRLKKSLTSTYLLAIGVFPLGVHSKQFLCDLHLQVIHWGFVIVWAAGL